MAFMQYADRNHVVAAAMLGVAAVFLIVMQFIPWAASHTEADIGGTSTFVEDFTAFSWRADFVRDNADASIGWYASDMDGEAGIGMIRIAAPLVVVALALAASAAMAVGAAQETLASVTGWVGTGAMVIGTAFMSMGILDMRGGSDEFGWSAAFFLAIVSCILLAAGAAMAMVAQKEALASGRAPDTPEEERL